MANLSIPSFSITSRTSFDAANQMLQQFFIKNGYSASDAVAQAGLVLNLKQQNYSDAEINTAIASQQNTLNSIAAAQAAQAAAALAAEQPKIAAALALSKTAQATEGVNYGGNTLITVNGVIETRDQAANFAENSSGCMEADPDNPRGPQITCAEAAQKRARNANASYSNSSVANAPAVSKVVAINGVSVSDNTTKPQILGTVTPITDPTKTYASVVSQSQTDLTKSTTPTPTPTPATATDPIKQFTDWLSNLITPVAKPVSDALTSTETAASNALADAQKAITAGLTTAQQQAADLAAAGTKQASDALAAAQKQAGDLITNAESNIANLLAKFNGAIISIPDPTKTVTPTPTPTTPTPTTPTPTPPPATKPTLTTQVTNFLKKYSIPIVIAVGAAGSLAVVLEYNSKQGIIAK